MLFIASNEILDVIFVDLKLFWKNQNTFAVITSGL